MTTVRIKEVAKLARVSTATVSHVINKTRFVSDDTKRKVLYAIERVGYTPNIHARNLASGQSRTLGLIISDITNPFFPDLVKSIQERALELGYDVIVLNTNYEPERDSRYVQRLLELRVRGVMILTTEMDLSVIERLSSREIAVVFLDIGKVGPHTIQEAGLPRNDEESSSVTAHGTVNSRREFQAGERGAPRSRNADVEEPTNCDPCRQ